ncbi:histone deacetylase [Candidatus Oleimmundimicrobium sp.]|uniref:histone deacetylase family protein n=1 Tax=Candidatus Oleimmundimicrobium sp. TaxID=3060597 RepID=UPI002721BA31|nr:histone deacetylase [Candidatus Oleimmundimicrobium sp.]MDO8885648.1 histone deacetylase [Candidatus Oleimmundimicrobium sp.]
MENRTALLYDPIYLKHFAGFGHPERPERLTVTLSILEEKNILSKLIKIKPQKASPKEITSVHSSLYLKEVEDLASRGGGNLDSDTVISSDSYETALFAAGAVITAVDKVLDGAVDNAFCLVRPPGHHATSRKGMGFCIFNNLAVGTKYAQKRGLSRILILDWDAHHGNGIQEIFYEDSSVLYISLHQYPFFPGSGYYDQVGAGGGKGFTVNLPLSAGTGDVLCMKIFDEVVNPIAYQFKPELIMVAGGYDGHFADPLTSLKLTVPGYSKLTKKALNLADDICGGKLVVSLEGGYELKALSHSIAATLNEMGNFGLKIKDPHGLLVSADKVDLSVIDKVKKVQKEFWKI